MKPTLNQKMQDGGGYIGKCCYSQVLQRPLNSIIFRITHKFILPHPASLRTHPPYPQSVPTAQAAGLCRGRR